MNKLNLNILNVFFSYLKKMLFELLQNSQSQIL